MASNIKAFLERPETLELEKEIGKIFSRISAAPMRKTSHGYQLGIDESILDAALRNSADYTRKSRESSAIEIMVVVLAANRAYERQVKRHADNMRQSYAGITLKELHEKVKKMKDYTNFKAVWGHKDKKKFATLSGVLNCVIPWLGELDTVENDFFIMNKWAQSASIEKIYSDEIGRLDNIGIATFQHLRMTFGVDTVKPDQRVMEVLERDFGWKVTQESAILAVEKIAKILGHSALLVDQVFVKYGSGHYTDEAKAVERAEREIIRKIKRLKKLSHQDISDVTGWSLEQVNAVEGDQPEVSVPTELRV